MSIRFLNPHNVTHGAAAISKCREASVRNRLSDVRRLAGDAEAYPTRAVGFLPESEIGIVRNLADFPDEQARLVRQALARRYFIHRIERIHKIGRKYGFIHLDVGTDKGRVEFFMRRRNSAAIDYGRRGKVLVDVYKNRYLIPDVDALPTREQHDFRRIIYW